MISCASCKMIDGFHEGECGRMPAILSWQSEFMRFVPGKHGLKQERWKGHLLEILDTNVDGEMVRQYRFSNGLTLGSNAKFWWRKIEPKKSFLQRHGHKLAWLALVFGIMSGAAAIGLIVFKLLEWAHG